MATVFLWKHLLSINFYKQKYYIFLEIINYILCLHCSLFEGTDQDGDNFLSFPELKEFLYEIRFRNSHWDKDKKLAEVMKEFDLDGDKKITMDEFVEVFTKWLDETKRTMDKQYHSVKSLKDLYKVIISK